MEQAMRKIKKYSNRKLYDTTDKKYVSLSRISELVMGGEEVYIVDSKTGEDLTSATISQILARNKNVPTNVLTQLLQKGQGTLGGATHYATGQAKKYASLWQNAFTMAEGEVDKLIQKMVKNKEISESDSHMFKMDMLGMAGNMRTWLTEKVEQQTKEALAKMKLPSRNVVQKLESTVDELTARVKELEKKLKK